MQKFGLFVLHSFQNEFVVVAQVKNGPRGPGVAQLPHGLGAEGDEEVLPLDPKEVQEVAESQGGVRPKCELRVRVNGGLVGPLFGELGRLHRHEILHE